MYEYIGNKYGQFLIPAIAGFQLSGGNEEQLINLFDFRSIDMKKTKIYDEYVSKCLKILIEYMVVLNILSKEQSNEYLRISSVGFVPI